MDILDCPLNLNRHVICDFKTRTFFVNDVFDGAVFTRSAFRAKLFQYRVEARIKADRLNAMHPEELDCDVITYTGAWALEQIRRREEQA